MTLYFSGLVPLYCGNNGPNAHRSLTRENEHPELLCDRSRIRSIPPPMTFACRTAGTMLSTSRLRPHSLHVDKSHQPRRECPPGQTVPRSHLKFGANRFQCRLRLCTVRAVRLGENNHGFRRHQLVNVAGSETTSNASVGLENRERTG